MPQRMVGILVRRIERIKRKTGRFAQLKNHNEGATGKNKKGNDKMEVKEIKFYDDSLLGVRDEKGIVWLAVKKTCIDIGLSEGQA